MKSITRQEWYGALVAVLVLGLLLSFASPYFLPGVGITIISTIVIWSLIWWFKRPKSYDPPKDPFLGISK